MEADPQQFLRDHGKLRRNRLTGIALMCGALACFSCLDTTAKYLVGHMDSLQVVWARYTSAFLLALMFYNPLSHPGMMRTKRPVLQLARSALLLGSTALNFIAVRYLQLDEALSILFSTPLIVAALAGPLLGEWIGWRRWLAILVGFSGVLLVTRPGAGGIHPAAILTFGSAVCYALYVIATRVLSRHDSTETTLFYSNLVGALAMLPVLPFVWSMPQSWFIVFLMIILGGFASFGHYLLIAGHRLAPASTLAPFIYTQIVWTTALGFLVFGDIPNRWTVAGAAIVIASGLYLLYRERTIGGRRV
jgi:drug/metabolite transporter (DMT)-like permease